ncbi:MAG: addiction module protein [Lentisphaeria bacterium]|nr:addiction module protein [Lentisphaeria bacterium]
MTIADLQNLSLHEKLQIMEAIWLDLRDHADTCPIPAEHLEILEKRRERLSSGEASIRDWDQIKNSIGRP